MDCALLNPSRFLKSQEFNGKDVTYTLASVVLEDLEDEAGAKKTKGILGFKETPKLLVINRTNSDCLKAMFGRETDNWLGKRVTFFPAPFFDNFTKENTTAIRVRGSPDISAPVSVSIKLRKKKPTTMTMQRTGNATASYVPDNDAIEMEMMALRASLLACKTPEECDRTWSSGMGGRVKRLPPPEQAAFTADFKAHKTSLQKAAKSPEADPPPPADEQPAA